MLVTCHLSLATAAFAATHVTATYSLGQNPRVMATVNGQPEYGLVFAQRNKPVTYGGVEYGTTVVYGYLDVNGALNDGAGNLWLDLIPNLGATPADGYYVVTFNIQGHVHAEIWVVPDQATVTADVCRQAQPPSSTAPALFYQFLQEDGSDLPQRQKLNFTGAGVACLDNAGQLRTDCTFSGGGGGSAPIASATVSGTVKTDQTVSDPVVYLTSSTDSLLAGKSDTTHTHAESDVTNLVTDLASKVSTSRSVNTTSPLAGGGTLASDLTLTCPTCEVNTNKNQAGGYAGLDGSSKISGSQMAEVLSSGDLTDFDEKSGSGTTVIGATITSPAANQALTWNGSNWVNQAQLVQSVFGRSGAVTAQSGDYSAAQVTNAFDVTAANSLTNVAAPATPAAGKTSVWTDSTDKNVKAKDDAGAVSVTVKPQACTGADKVSAISSAGVVTCSTDQTGGAGGGYDTLKGDSGTASKTGTEAAKIQGTANEIATVAADDSPDDTVTLSLAPQLNLAGKEIIGGATPLKFEGATDDDVYTTLTVTDPTSARTFTLPDADSVAVQPDPGAANNFLTAISASGVISKAQPDFSNLSGTASDSQIPSGITRDTEVNVQGTANEITSSGSGVAPTLSLAPQLNLSGKEILGGSTPLKFEGATDDDVYTTLAVTDPTGARSFTLPDADSVAVQPQTCTGTDKVSAVSSAGVVTCSADQDSGGTPAWESLTNSADSATTYTSDNPAETVTFDFQSAFTTGSQFTVKSSTGNPTGGTVGEFQSHDADVTALWAHAPAARTAGKYDLFTGPAVSSYTAFVQGFLDDIYGVGFATKSSASSGNIGTQVSVVEQDAATTGTPAAIQTFGVSENDTGNVTGLYGLVGSAWQEGAGTVSGMYGIEGYVYVDATTGDVTTAASLHAATNVNSDVLTNNYGLLVEDQSGIGTNNWAIRTLGTAQSQFGGLVNAVGGFQVNGSALNFSDLAGTVGDAQIAAGAVDGGPGGEIADGSITSADLATANKTISKSIDIFDPTTADTNKIQFYWPAAVTLQRIACSTDTGSVSINFDERAESTPNTSGTNALSAALACDSDSQTTSSFADSTQAADVPINLQITATSGTPTVVRIHVKAQIN